MRSVLFVDPPAFCTSLEGLVAPALRTRPLAVAPPGADRATINVVEVEDLPLAYLPGNSLRTRVRVVGEIAR